MSLNDMEEGCECQPSILIVDDSEFNIMSAKLLLEEYQVNIDIAQNGEIAVQMFET